MPILSALTPTEQRALIHKIQNARGRAEPGEEDAEDLYEHMVVHSAVIDEKLAKISEEENFNLKNRYRHQQKTMNFADKKRMPIHESKVADLLRNSHIYRSKIVDEVGTFEKEMNNTQINNGVLTYVNEAAFGELRDLITDVGIKDDTIDFVNLAKLNKKREQMLFASDVQARYLQNALYTPLDMTDYEDTFVSWRELPGALPIAHSEKLLEFQMEDFP